MIMIDELRNFRAGDSVQLHEARICGWEQTSEGARIFLYMPSGDCVSVQDCDVAAYNSVAAYNRVVKPIEKRNLVTYRSGPDTLYRVMAVEDGYAMIRPEQKAFGAVPVVTLVDHLTHARIQHTGERRPV